MSPLSPSEASLTESQRTAWHALGVFTAPFDEAAALAIAGAGPDTLDVLVRGGLLVRDGNHFRLPDPAAARAELPPEILTSLHLAHARHYTSIGKEADRLHLAGGESELAGLALFEAVRPHFETAFAWLAGSAGIVPASPTEASTDGPSGRERSRESARLLLALANATAHTSAACFEPGEWIGLLQAQLRAARIIGDREAEGLALSNLGNAHYSTGDARRALECHEKAMAISKETGIRHGDGQDWACMGMAYAALGDARLALTCYENQLAAVQESGDRHGEGKAWGNMGIAHTRLKEARRALECYEKQLAIMQEAGDRRGEAVALGNIGLTLTAMGSPRRALECHEKAMQIAQEIGDPNSEGQAWASMGGAHADMGHLRRAVECFEKRRAIAQETGDRRGEATALFNSASKLWDLNAPGDRDEARQCMTAAAEIFAALESPNLTHARAKLKEWGT